MIKVVCKNIIRHENDKPLQQHKLHLMDYRTLYSTIKDYYGRMVVIVAQQNECA